MTPKNLLLPAVLSLLCLCFSNDARSQAKKVPSKHSRPTKDTLVIQFGEIDRIAIPLSSVYKVEVANLNGLLRQLNQDLKAAIDSLAGTSSPIIVLYQETADWGRRLQVTSKPVERSELYYVRETGEIRRRPSPDSIVVERADKQRLFFVLDRLASFKELGNRNLDSIITRAKEAIAVHGQLNGMKNASIPYGGWLRVTYSVQQKDPQGIIGVGTYEDFGLVLIAGTGVGLVRDKVVPEFGVGIGYRFPRSKGYLGLKLTTHYFFNRRTDDSYAMNINSFLSVDLGEVKSGNALSIGYLIHRSGGYFKGTTFKISQTVGAGKLGKLRLIPELIITDNFRVYFPGIRLGLMF